MNLIEKYISEMRDRPFTMVLLCLVTMMSLQTSVDYVPTSRHDHLSRRHYVHEQRLIKVEYETRITEQRAYKNSKENQLDLLRFLQSTNPKLSTAQVDVKREELQEEIISHEQVIVRLYSQQTEELKELKALYEAYFNQKDGVNRWNAL